jgi:hypothetical protein
MMKELRKGVLLSTILYGIVSGHGQEVPRFQTLQGLYLSEAAFELSYFLDENRYDFLEDVQRALKSYDDYLWSFRDSDGDGCLESWSMTDTGEDHMERLHYAPWIWPFDYPPTKENIPVHDGELMYEMFRLILTTGATFSQYSRMQATPSAMRQEW